MSPESLALDRSVVPARPLRVGLVGLGPVGLEIARALARKPWARIVAAADVDPSLQGEDLAALAGWPDAPEGPEVRVRPRLDAGCDVVAHATVSDLERATSQITDLLATGASVVSTCEGLAFPLEGDLARRLDQAAREADAAVLGTGVNPGFLLDVLPATLTVACQEVERIRARRVVDAGERRRPLQEKIGAGLDLDEWTRRRDEGEIRHVGLPESARMLAAAVGWTSVDFGDETIEPVVAEEAVTTEFVEVAPGQAAGVRQRLHGRRDGRRILELELAMYVGAERPADAISVEGIPPVEMVVEGGVHGDRATAGVVANMVPRIATWEPGLHTMADLPAAGTFG